METMKSLIASILLLVACSAQAQFRANPWSTNGPLQNGFVFGGDSLSDISPFSNVGQQVMWDQLLMRNTNYVIHMPTYYTALGATTASNWVSLYYTQLVRSIMSPFPANYYFNLLIGVNDIGLGRTENQLTNDLATLWAMGHADGLKVIGHTIPLIAWGSPAQSNIWIAVNNDIRNMTNLFDVFIDTGTTITNTATQTSGGVHWTIQQQTNYANWFATQFTPPLSRIWHTFAPPTEFPDNVWFDKSDMHNGGIFVSGGFAEQGGRPQRQGLIIAEKEGLSGPMAFLYSQTDAGVPGPFTLFASSSVFSSGPSQFQAVQTAVTTINIFSGTSATQLVLNLDLGSLTVFATNGFSMTNFSNLEAGWGTVEKTLEVDVVGCTNTANVIALPLFGPSYGVVVRTNANILLNNTNAIVNHYTWKAKGTNLTLFSRAFE